MRNSLINCNKLKSIRIKPGRLFVVIFIIFIAGCTTNGYENVKKLDNKPAIDPDYAGVTIPPNIAPMNFTIQEAGDFFKVELSSPANDTRVSSTSSDGVVCFPEGSWRKVLNSSKGQKIKIQVFSLKRDEKVLKQFNPIYMHVAKDPIDPYLSYRLLYPGYVKWDRMKVIQRSLEGFEEKSLVDNRLLDNSCTNCHSFNKNNPNKFLVHIRGSKSGTYFVNCNKVTKTALKTKYMPGGATYPAWQPNGRYVAFSSNNVTQSFYAHPRKSIEVYDLNSKLTLYDTKKNEMFTVWEKDTTEYMQTFPSWSPDGKYLYFCRTKHVEKEFSVENLKHIHYDLARKSFHPDSGTFGKTEVIFDASAIKQSVSFPKLSPDGQYVVFTLHDYGTFPIWHKEADLYLLHLESRNCKKMNINSKETESYHNWSSNGKWLVFSSKRRDGRSARPYFAYFGGPDHVGKPFVLPQEDPTHYDRMLKTYNIPEFVTGKIQVNPRDFADAAKGQALRANPGNPLDTLPKWLKEKEKEGATEMEWKIHE